mgnify:CR=1 FL=1
MAFVDQYSRPRPRYLHPQLHQDLGGVRTRRDLPPRPSAVPSRKGPGVILVFAPIDRIVRVSLRQEALEVPPQDIITRDNVTLKVNAVIFSARDRSRTRPWSRSRTTSTRPRSSRRPRCAPCSVSRNSTNCSPIARKINLRLQSILDTHTAPWGVKVTNVEVKQVDMPESMLRAMAKQAEAEREKRSKIIHAEGEFSAAQRLVDAAQAARHRTGQRAVALFADPDRDRRREKHHGHLPCTGRFLLRPTENAGQGRRR